MIKAEVTVVGTVTQAAQIKQNKEGNYFYSASLKSSIPHKEGGFKEVSISLAAPQDFPGGLESLVLGQRYSVKGTLTFNKKEDQTYLNMSVKETATAEGNAPDNISGELSMIGVVGNKGPEVKTGKTGKPYMNFSAYSSDGKNDERVFTWVRFTRFNGEVEPFLVPKMLIQAGGTLELQFYKEKLSLGCKLSSIQPYVKKAPSEAPF